MQLMSLPDGRLLAALHTKIQTPPFLLPTFLCGGKEK
jgi:hypothetical protein